MTELATNATARTRACLDEIARHDDDINAMITVAAATAQSEAAAADAAAGDGRWLGLLHGMPIAIKDNIHTAGLRTTSGSLFFADHVPNHDAEVVRRLRAAGAVIVGKASMHELAFGIRSDNPVRGQCRNPWHAGRIPGGSSGGSGAAVAAGMCDAALGTDTGGSVRLPAAMTGVTGLRPTTGRVPNTGTTPVSPRHDTIGPMARRVTDVARLFAVIAGYDPADPVAVDQRLDNFLPALHDGIAGQRIGLPTNFYFDGADAEVAALVRAGAGQLAELGAELIEVEVPGVADIHHWASITIFADACAYHADRLDTAPDKFSPQVYERMTVGRTFSAVDYANAIRARDAWRRAMLRLFGDIDILLTPTVPTLVPPIEDDKSLLAATRDATQNTYAGAFADLPGLSLPCGFTSDGLPVGMQLEAAPWREPLLLRAGTAYQSVTDWHLRQPQLPSGHSEAN